MTNYISISLIGGIANQMFQIAIIHAIAWEYNLIPIVKYMDKYENEKDTPRNMYFTSLFHKVKCIDAEIYAYINFIPIYENNKIEILKNTSYKLHGYYQSPKYFDKYRDEIIQLFQTDCDIKIKELYNVIKQDYTTISIHIRRGDYLQLSHYHTNLTMEYYDKATQYFNDNVLFIIFSDDIKWCKDNFKYKNMYFVEEINNIDLPQEVIELKLMSLCDNNIIANSTFSWWGAYLNENSNKTIAPKTWFVNEKKNNDMKDIYCEKWIVI
jgi:hypothetical protein